MTRVLVVGGGGYVGCVLTEELLAKGYSVRVLDRLFFGREALGSALDRIELVVEDLREIDESHLEDCGAVINLGGLSNDPTAEFSPKANEEMNTVGAIRVAEMARRAGAERLVFASTASIYDRGVGEEVQDVLKHEDAPVDPKAAYATSKLAAERGILPLAGPAFAPVAFRMGTVFGFSPRMRYDLVVNAFVKDALSQGKLHVIYGGSMWRPLIDVKDVARAFVTALECDPAQIRGETFNLVGANFRISEVALRTQRTLTRLGIPAELHIDYSYRLVRSYRMSAEKAMRVLGFSPRVTVEESIENMVAEIGRRAFTDFSHPRYYNIEWMKLLEEISEIVASHGYVLTRPEWLDERRQGSGAVARLPSGRVRPAG